MDYQDTIKAAAKRMCEQLEAKGVHVKHTQMLEALATGFGVDSWRELKAVIDAPRIPPKPKTPPLGEMQQWSVDGMYYDNQQQYGDSCQARVPLEAAISTIMERRTDCGLEIGILNVYDEADVCHLSPSFMTEIELYRTRDAFKRLYDAVADIPELTPDQAISKKWLGGVLDVYKDSDMLEELMDYDELDRLSGYRVELDPAPIMEGQTLLPSQALTLLCEAVENHIGLLKMVDDHEPLATAVFQIEALCGYFEPVLDDRLSSPITEIEFD